MHKEFVHPNAAHVEPSPVRLAVFDFDGTSMEGNSPVILVWYLAQRGMLSKRVLIRIIVWAIAYKLRLPQNECWVRGLVFRAFRGRPKVEVDQFLADFYDAQIEKRFRPKAQEAMYKHQEEGCRVVVVSATFEPIIARAMERHPFDSETATIMHVDEEGCYTCEVEGEPIEGAQKLHVVTTRADQKYGKGNWELTYAYGDHHSDKTLLEAALYPHAVTPDRPLRRAARKNGWPILDWTYQYDKA